MTQEEAIVVLQKIKPAPRRADGKSTIHTLETIALDMAIEALEQENILDKIRAEIEEIYMNLTYEEIHKVGGSWGLRKALEIIDKYKVENEGE